MSGLGCIQLVTPPTLVDADVLLRFATVGFACVLAALSTALSPFLVLSLLAAALIAQVVYELAAHERHSGVPEPVD
jgi:hypothetical protein